MKRTSMWLLAALVALAGPVHADATFTYLFTGGYPLGMSADGKVIGGNNVSDYGPFRWTQETGRVELGMASAPLVGGSAGTAMISADGTRVASTIASQDSTLITQGLWTSGQGWQWLLPPGPPNAGEIDRNLGSVWALSGDGNTVVGLYWLSTGRAHGSRWTQATGVVDLGTVEPNRSSRADAVDYDGSVIAGWTEHPTGFRRACAWMNDQISLLGGTDRPGEAHAVNTMGTIIGGYQTNPATTIREAAIWKRNGGAFGATQFLGSVPGTAPDGYGLNVVYGMSTDGSIVVGYCSFSGDPFYTTGFVWTPSTGILDVNQFLANHGILPDPSFSIASLTAVTPDGKYILGWGKDVIQPYTTRAFLIRLDPTATDLATNSGEMRVRLSAKPNPLHSTTTLQFSLPSDEVGVLSIYDSAGRLVRRLHDGVMAAGAHRVAWDGRDATGTRVVSGVYFSRLETATTRTTSKLVVLE